MTSSHDRVAALPPAVIVHGLGDVRDVLAVAMRHPVTFLSAPGAASYAGCGWWRALMAQARAEFPDASLADVLDCGGASGDALAALRIGQALLVLSPAAPGRDAVAAMAADWGGAVLPCAPPALDMAQARDRRRLHEWLHQRTTPGDSGPTLG